MYAVVYKDRVIVGPMDWNRSIFQGSLEKENVIVGLPRVVPETLPYIINEDAKIALVEEQRPEINPAVEFYYGPQWDLSGDKAVAVYEAVDTPIDFARYNLKVKAAEARWKKETAGTKINIQDIEVSLDTSRDGRNIFVQKHSIMAEEEVVNWKFSEGWLSLTKSELGSIVTAGSNYIQSCFDWEKTINDEIDAAASKEELLSIDAQITEQTVE
jgi:hypothetical protein